MSNVPPSYSVTKLDDDKFLYTNQDGGLFTTSPQAIFYSQADAELWAQVVDQHSRSTPPPISPVTDVRDDGVLSSRLDYTMPADARATFRSRDVAASYSRLVEYGPQVIQGVIEETNRVTGMHLTIAGVSAAIGAIVSIAVKVLVF